MFTKVRFVGYTSKRRNDRRFAHKDMSMTRELPESNDKPAEPVDGEVRVLVTSQAYAEFSDWIDGELTKLVVRWAHRAAPNADVPRRKVPQR